MTRAVCIQEAKAVLVDCFGATDADLVLRAWSTQLNTSIEEIADVLLHQIWQGTIAPEDRALARAIEHFLRQLPDLPRAGAAEPARTPTAS